MAKEKHSEDEVKELGEKLLALSEDPILLRYHHINIPNLANYAGIMAAGPTFDEGPPAPAENE